jgi:small subunit ribosomal protein S21
MNGIETVQLERENVAEIRLQEGESLENALRRFKRKVQTEDIIKEVKRHSYYLKPGERRRVKQALARKRARKKNRKEGSFARDVCRACCDTQKENQVGASL